MLSLFLMALVLGATSFGCGILPLSFVFSKSHLDRLSWLGTGLLLGAALGVIIPEGLEAIAHENPSEFPTSQVALSLLGGFIFMLIVEQFTSHSHGPHSHSLSGPNDVPLHGVNSNAKHSQVEFDAELGDLEGMETAGYSPALPPHPPTPPPVSASSSGQGTAGPGRAFPLTFGLVVHGLADGLALGASALTQDKGDSAGSHAPTNLSLIVFLALAIHKAPTSLALTTSLLSTSPPIPRAQCKKYLAVFASSTPLGAIGSYMLLNFLGQGEGGWTGIALLVSGGTFLYVATVLQPVSDHSSSPTTISETKTRGIMRVFHIVIGMCIPYLISSIFGHGH